MKPTDDNTKQGRWVDHWKAETEDDWYFKMFFEPLIDCASPVIDNLTERGGLLLDLGCAEGRKTRLLDRYGVTVVGIDINEEGIKVGASIHPSTMFVVGDMQALPFRDGSFDVIFSSSVLQLVDWRRVIRECRRILKKDGRAVFIENLRGNLFAKGYRLARRVAHYRYPRTEIPMAHIEWGERGEFEEVFSETEFDVFHVMTPVLLVVPALNHLLRGTPIQMSGQGVYRLLHRIDRWLLSKFPAVANLGWMLVVKATK